MASFPWQATAGRRKLSAGLLASVAGALALAVIPAGADTIQTGEYDFTTSNTPYAITAYNYSTASGSDAIFGATFAAGGKGIYGYTADTSTADAAAFGVAGISQNGYGVYGSSYAPGVTAIYGENMSAGAGVQGDSAEGNGAVGVGAFNGVYGETLGTVPGVTSAGVFGTDTSVKSAAYGVFGQTTKNIGVYGASSGTGAGVYAFSQSGDSLVALSASGGRAYLGTPNGIGVSALGYSGTATYPALTATIETAGTDIFGGYGLGGETFIVQGTSADNSGAARPASSGGASDVQISGDLYVYGKIYSDCDAFPVTSLGECSAGPYVASTTPTTGGARVQTYLARQTLPTVEDVGSAELTAGAGIVRIDPAFASTIAPGAGYHVFLTPKGDSRGLYVQSETAAGFVVRENQGGRSTLAFDYRIVATPLDTFSARRLALAAPKIDRSPKFATYRAPRKQSIPHPATAGPPLTRPPRIAPPAAAQLRIHR
jgi:hypothetical protein